MAFSSTRVTVTNSATLITQADADGTSVVLKNTGSTTVDLGGSGVTSGAGLELAGGETVRCDLDASESIYGITASGSQVIQVGKNRA